MSNFCPLILTLVMEARPTRPFGPTRQTSYKTDSSKSRFWQDDLTPTLILMILGHPRGSYYMCSHYMWQRKKNLSSVNIFTYNLRTCKNAQRCMQKSLKKAIEKRLEIRAVGRIFKQNSGLLQRWENRTYNFIYHSNITYKWTRKSQSEHFL